MNNYSIKCVNLEGRRCLEVEPKIIEAPSLVLGLQPQDPSCPLDVANFADPA